MTVIKNTAAQELRRAHNATGYSEIRLQNNILHALLQQPQEVVDPAACRMKAFKIANFLGGARLSPPPPLHPIRPLAEDYRLDLPPQRRRRRRRRIDDGGTMKKTKRA